MVKFWIWFWSFVSGMGLITSITTYTLGEPNLALTNFCISLLTTLVALKYMEEVNQL